MKAFLLAIGLAILTQPPAARAEPPDPLPTEPPAPPTQPDGPGRIGPSSSKGGEAPHGLCVPGWSARAPRYGAEEAATFVPSGVTSVVK